MNGKVGLAGILKGRAMAIHSLPVRMCRGYVCMYIYINSISWDAMRRLKKTQRLEKAGRLARCRRYRV